MRKKEVESIKKFVRATNYLTAIQIFLKENCLLNEPLSPNNIKSVLLGHWGTCPGINFTYAHLNNLVRKEKCNLMFVLGPGHGFPALQANLFLEGTLEKFYPKAKLSKEGINYLAKKFSWPYGFPSHTNPGTPGAILEGGELGYSLSTSYGAILDNTDLIVACLIGDGEAETGPIATAWHLNKFVDPAKNGAVLPIMHINEHKISGPTIFGRMSNQELKYLFKGYGYEPIIVEGKNIHEKMIKALEYSYEKIRQMQNKAKSGKEFQPIFPVILLKTPKGWTGIKKLHGEKIEGTDASHQIILKKAKTDKKEMNLLEEWLESYKFEELFKEKGGFDKDILDLIPKGRYKIGLNKHAFPEYKPLKLPNIKKFAEQSITPGEIGSNSMRKSGDYMGEVFKLNDNFRFFSPDETYSNKLEGIFKGTKRAFIWPIKSWDKDMARQGKVIEILSEHSLEGLAQGYILTGRHCVFTSYAAFIEIISSMNDQYMKFLKVKKELPWRKSIPSLNYILTSSGWRQQHNGFSHQNPSFISGILEKPGNNASVYFPSDENSTLVALKHCLQSKDKVNVIVAGKTTEPKWMNLKQAEKLMKEKIITWDFASSEKPDLVFVGIGDYTTKECIAAIDLLKKDASELKLRFVNILEVTAFSRKDIEKFLTEKKPVIINYHGYQKDIKALLADRKDTFRFKVNGYIEEGSTTTPFDMHVRNNTDRFNLAIQALKLTKNKSIKKSKTERLIKKYKENLESHKRYIIKHGIDQDYIKWWKWENNSKK